MKAFSRRKLLEFTALAPVLSVVSTSALAMNKKRYRVAIIGSTNHGGFGHGIDIAFKDAERFELVAVADDDPAGLAAAGKRLGVERRYAAWREMLDKEKPDIVGIGPRWVTDRVAMVTAAAETGCHIFLEKPIAANLRDADAMLATCRRHRVKCCIAHQLRVLPPVRSAFADVRAGKYGDLLRITGRPTDDARGGGEELIVHGTHFFDLMVALAGPPRWVTGQLQTGERETTTSDKHAGREPVGPVAGDSAEVTIGFDHGVRGFWHSTANLKDFGIVYGLLIECQKALICVRPSGETFVYPAPTIAPENISLAWKKIEVANWHTSADGKSKPPSDFLYRGNKVLVSELVAAIENDREPAASLGDAVLAMEIIQGTYTSHFAGGRRVKIPLEDRRHPLGEE